MIDVKMKTSGFIAISWAVLAFCCPGAQAQDNGRGTESVDVSVHARVEDQAQEPQPSQNSAKRPTMPRSWSSQPAKQGPSAVAWPSHATASTSDRAADRTSGGSRSRPDPFGILALRGAHGSSTLPLTQKDPASPASVPPEIQGFPSLFPRKQAGLTGTAFQTNFSHAKGNKAKRHKPHPARPADSRQSTAGEKH